MIDSFSHHGPLARGRGDLAVYLRFSSLLLFFSVSALAAGSATAQQELSSPAGESVQDNASAQTNVPQPSPDDVGEAQRSGQPTSSGRFAEFQAFAEVYCVECHAGAFAEAHLDLENLHVVEVAERLHDWRRVLRVLTDGSMPPEDAYQSDAQERQQLIEKLRDRMDQLARDAAREPGPTMLRRLTNAEYEYCVEDLTGLRLEMQDRLIGDSVGSSGFTNTSTGQFMQVDSLERYLETAKIVAQHLMVGAGPLYFAEHPGRTGRELSAIERIQAINRRFGYRDGAGEGAKPFGIEHFAKAFNVAWQYRYRHELNQTDATLSDLARLQGLNPGFAEHIFHTLQQPDPPFPLSEICGVFAQFPRPWEITGDQDQVIQDWCVKLETEMHHWQDRFAESASAEEEKALLTWNPIHIPDSADFVVVARRRQRERDDNFTPDLNDPSIFVDDRTVKFKMAVDRVQPRVSNDSASVIFRSPKVVFNLMDQGETEALPLSQVMTASQLQAIGFGERRIDANLGSEDFVVSLDQPKTLEFQLPENCRSGKLILHAELDPVLGKDSVVRCVIEDVTGSRVQQYSSLLRDRTSDRMETWEQGLELFASSIPQISHREPAPSDRDPIPALYDDSYNHPERNYFHATLKYHRDDQFLVRHLLPQDAAKQLDAAWTDLLTSFDYHDLHLRFIIEKFGLKPPRVASEERATHQQKVQKEKTTVSTMADVDLAWVKSLPDQPRRWIQTYHAQYSDMHQALRAAEPNHLDDLAAIARKAWRRPIGSDERAQLDSFYRECRSTKSLDHDDAVRATLVRILVSPEFLYRLERPATSAEPRLLSDTELASRLSFALWSSLPDDGLLTLASAGKLSDPEVLDAQVTRMLADQKSRRLATEFFGQWLGFYQFDRFRGVDPDQFPEFDEQVRRALHEEAISFFHDIIRHDRPYHAMIEADYRFVNRSIAEHYGLSGAEALTDQMIRQQVSREDRPSGLLTLGAVLTTTSAPLRTSPVKRGDWILRRLIGTPVPPPPADAGSIAAEEVLSDGMTVRERLEAHRTRSECMTCHVRIDPLGFALEHFDSLGRWRDNYSDGQAIDASGELRDGTMISGYEGLIEYLESQDQAIRETLARKMVAYILGRSETLADTQLIQSVASTLGTSPQFSNAVRIIVDSPQFRMIRGSGSRISALPANAPTSP